ncbi:MAG: ABC transporter permease [Thermoguttaceae bacterium]|nr:ABC transporter permease [Thermoguttaceae bacterium]
MKFVWKIVLSRMKRQKVRLLFVLLAIAASSCLIVWVIGGFNALFLEATDADAKYLGEYDLKVYDPGSEQLGFGGGRGGAGFSGPFTTGSNNDKNNSDGKSGESAKEPPASPELDALRASLDAFRDVDGSIVIANLPQNLPPPMLDAVKTIDANGDGKIDADEEKNAAERFAALSAPTGRDGDGRGRRGRGGRRDEAQGVFSEELIASIRADEAVALCDETATLRMFVYSPGAPRSILQDEDPVDEDARPTLKRSLDLSDEELDAIGEAPKGIDPDLHRKAFGAYRATMGTPMGFGSTFQGTTASQAPYELKEGRWFAAKNQDGSVPYEAVMTTRGNLQHRAKVGDSILLIDRSSLIGEVDEYQLKVVGIVDDTETDGFYISYDLAREISKNSPVAASALFLKLRGSVDEFRARWNDKLKSAAPSVATTTSAEIAEQKIAAIKNNESFKIQAASGTLLAALASLLIVFTALNMSVDEQKRLIAFYRLSGLTRRQVGTSILFEAIVLALPGWTIGMFAGWLLVLIYAHKPTGLNWQTTTFSFVCTFLGAIVAALYPIFQSARVKPLDAINEPEKRFLSGKRRRRQTIVFLIAAVLGLASIGADLYLVYSLQGETTRKAVLHSVYGLSFLAVGVVLLLPITIRLAELVLLPILAALFRFDSSVTRREFSGNARRVAACAIALSVGGGLFVSMQIWGYSLLDQFLPERLAPEAFAAFLPNGLRPEIVDEMKKLPSIDAVQFLPVAVEQAAFTDEFAPDDPRKKAFANVVFFGLDVEKAFEGKKPFIQLRFRQGDPKKAWREMKSGRGVVVTDSLVVDYRLNLGDTLKVVHPRDPEKVLEYPVVGVVSFPGWQWLSKTGGVRRNFGRSGGMVFAREDVVANDYQLDRRSYFWFNAKPGEKIDYQATELACDFLARKNLQLDRQETNPNDGSSDQIGAQTAYVKLSTRESLTSSITARADSVIWGLSKVPLVTLAITSIAVIGAIANSVRARRWSYGVMRAVGLTRWALVRSILVEAILVGVVASAASFAFGFLAAQGALKLGQSIFGTVDPPLILPVKGLSFGFALTVALCLIASLYPAFKIGRTEPLKLLQSGRTVE